MRSGWPLRRLLALLLSLALATGAPAVPLSPFFPRWLGPNSRALAAPYQNPAIPSPSQDRFLTPNDFASAETAPVALPTAEELSGMEVGSLFEGDIAGVAFEDGVLRDATDILRLPQHSALNLGTYPDKLWPAAEVPYQLEEGLEEHQRVALAQAFKEYASKTCVRFVPRKGHHYDYVYIKRNKHLGCSSYVGRAGGNQTISLEVGKCFTKGIVAHELMHSLGFFHEHSRTDRNSFVGILEENVKPGMLRNFEKYPQKIIDTLDMPYDYASVMHYHKLAFSKNGKPTIRPKDPDAEIGQRYRLSEIDAAKVNKLYQCDEDAEEGGEEEGEAKEPKPSPAQPSTTKKPRKNRWTIGEPKKPSSGCADLNEHCQMWSEIGHCKWSEKYMNHYCRKSCGVCQPSAASSTTSTTDSPTSTTTSSSSSTSEAPTSSTSTTPSSPSSSPAPKAKPSSKPTSFVPVSPKKSTKGSGGSGEEGPRCLDQNLFCGYWSRIGECKSESKFMKIFCKRSCDLC